MFSKIFSWLLGDHTRSAHSFSSRQISRCRPYPLSRPPRAPTPPPKPAIDSQSSLSLVSAIEGQPGSHPTTYRNLSTTEKADRFRNISEFVDLVNLENGPPFKDHSFVSAFPLTTPFFRAIVEHTDGSVQLPPHRRRADTFPINNTSFVPPRAPPSQPPVALLPSDRWLWGSRQPIRSGLFIDYVPGSARTAFKFGTINEYPIIHFSRTFFDTKSFLKEAELHRNKLRPLHGSVVMHPINATVRGPDPTINYEPPHHSFWITASPSMPECLKVLVKCAYVKLHNEGVVHNKVDLQNIFITPDLDVFIHDFGDTSSVQVHLNGSTSPFSTLPAQFKAEKMLVDSMLKDSSVDEPLFIVMPGQSRGDLIREVQEFLFKLDALEQRMFGGPELPAEYQEVLDVFDAPLSPSDYPRPAPSIASPTTPTRRRQQSPGSTASSALKGKRKASEGITPDSPRKRIRADEGDGERSDSGSSHTLQSDEEESERCHHTRPHDTINGKS